jgi:hypothetical protein
MSPFRAGRTLTAAAATALLLATAPAAMATTSSISGSINPDKGKVGTPIALKVRFTLDPAAGAEPDTLSKVVVQLPPNGVQNARFFPTCNAAQINAVKSFAKCPKGSQIGRGSLRADVTAVPVYNVPGTVTFFNGSRDGKKVTIHVKALRPVLINEAFDATLVRTGGRYGYKLTAVIPESLQEIYPSWFAQVRSFESVFDAKIKVKGKTRGYIEAKRCPKSRKVPVAAAFSFRAGGSSSAQSWIRCRP